MNKVCRYEASGEPGLEDTAGEKGDMSRSKDQARPGNADFQFIGLHQAGVCSTDQLWRYRGRASGFPGRGSHTRAYAEGGQAMVWGDLGGWSPGHRDGLDQSSEASPRTLSNREAPQGERRRRRRRDLAICCPHVCSSCSGSTSAARASRGLTTAPSAAAGAPPATAAGAP